MLLSRRPPAPKPHGLAGGREKRRHLRRDAQTRTQQRAAGTNNTALFDIVNTTTANGSQRAPRCRARVLALVSRTSDGEAGAKIRDPGATRQNRWILKRLVVSPLGRASRVYPTCGHSRADLGQARDRCLVPLAQARSLCSPGTRNRRSLRSLLSMRTRARKHARAAQTNARCTSAWRKEKCAQYSPLPVRTPRSASGDTPSGRPLASVTPITE